MEDVQKESQPQNRAKHYENTPIQIYRKNSPLKPENFQIKNSARRF